MVACTKGRWEAWLEGRASNSDKTVGEELDISLESPSAVKDQGIFVAACQALTPHGKIILVQMNACYKRCNICGHMDSSRHSNLECTMSKCVWALAEEDVTNLLQKGLSKNQSIETSPSFSRLRPIQTLYLIGSSRSTLE